MKSCPSACCGWQASRAILNPRSVRRFAEAMGTFEKTDDIDAGVIAHFAEVSASSRKPRPAPPSKSSKPW